MTKTEDLFVSVADDLNLHVRRVDGGDKTPVFCIPGLTRNAADFEDLAPQVAGTGRDVYAISLRGRGRSDRASDFRTYHPAIYQDDILIALEQLGVESAIFIGTSLGGIVTMLVNETVSDRIHAAVLNDIGPELAPEGLARIAGYVGQRRDEGPAKSLDEAAARIKAINEPAFPNRDQDFWRLFARRTFREENGDWVLDYDPDIAKGFAEGDPPPDLWAPFESLKDTPTLVIRGAISDLLTPPIIEKMRGVYPDFGYCEVPNVGHAPTLTEPVAFSTIETFLSKLD